MKFSRSVRITLLLLAVAGLIAGFVFLDARRWLRGALVWVESLGGWGPVLFILIYVAAAVVFIPGSALTLGAGALFGVIRGSLLVSAASTLAAAVAFLIARHAGRRWIARKVEGNAKFHSLSRAVGAEGWKLVLLTRLSPVFPYTLLNYAFGLTEVKFWHYLTASWIGMMPGTVMYVYLGSIARAGAEPQQRTPAQWILYAVGLAATVAVTIFITRIARSALAKRTMRPEEPESVAGP